MANGRIGRMGADHVRRGRTRSPAASAVLLAPNGVLGSVAGLPPHKPANTRPPSGRRERILTCLTGSPSSAILIRRGKRLADYLQADCIAVHVSGPAGREREAVERHMSFARNLRIDTQVVDGPDVAAAIANFARGQRITQIFMGRPGPRPFWKRLHESVVQQVVRQARDKQITIVAQRG